MKRKPNQIRQLKCTNPQPNEMIFFSRYCAIDIAPYVEEVKINQQGTLFAVTRQRTTPLCKLPSPNWVVLGRLKTIAANPRMNRLIQHCQQSGIEAEFNPVILRKQ